MRRNNLLYRIYHLYYDGFREMTIGRTLWVVILVKLFIMFAILKVFFFPDFIKQKALNGDEAKYVSKELMHRFNTINNDRHNQ